MGTGRWCASAFVSYCASSGRKITDDGVLSDNYGAQELFRGHGLDPMLDPFEAVRECCDSEEHPHTVPVILALDVTGSMGSAAAEVAKKLNVIMTELYEQVEDVEFLVMGIGDLAYDGAPIQISQFESDIRIAEQLDKIYFEGGGGGNSFESYTAAWYMGLKHTRLDCWKRGARGLIITLGDEPLNPYLPGEPLKTQTGDKELPCSSSDGVETKPLYEAVQEKYDIFHLAVKDKETCYDNYAEEIANTFGKLLDKEHLRVVSLDSLSKEIVSIVKHHAEVSRGAEAGVVDWTKPEEDGTEETLTNKVISW